MDSQQSSRNEKGAPPDDKLRVSAPQISLPKGGGAIRGIGEKFAANPVTGTGSLTVPIYTSPGRSGFGPQLSLSYDSGSGNGPFGFGWSLALPAITRKTDKGLPQYVDSQESDIFILSGAEDLMPSLMRPQGSGRATSFPRAPSTASNTPSIATARESRACLPASSAGSISPIRKTRSGAPSPRTTSLPGTARQRRAGSPTRRIPAASLAG